MGEKPVSHQAVSVVLVLGLLWAVPWGFATCDPDRDIQEALAELQGLEFDEFVDASYLQILCRSPETVTGLGLSESLGIGDDRLDNICNEYTDETYELLAGIAELLQAYDRSQLDYDQQVSFDSYSRLLADWAAEREFLYHFYPVHQGYSRQNNLFRFFSDEHPLESRQNAEDYLTRLGQIDDQLECLIQNLDDSEQRGIVAPAQILQQAADQIRGIVPGSAVYLPFYTAFSTRIASIVELGTDQRQSLLDQAEAVINAQVIPAYQALVDRLDEQIPDAPPMNGVWQLPDGDRFYESRLNHHTTTDLTPAEVHQMGLDEVERVRAQIRTAFDSLGYPANASFAVLFDRVGQDSGIVPAAQIVSLNESYIRQAQEDITEVFDIAPQAEVIVIGGASGGFYVSGSLDGSRPGAYYINNQHDSYRYWMRTIAYHETVPGHHFQIAIGNELDVPLFTKGGGFYTAYVEGWALYAEYLAWELGWYTDDICSDLGRLQWELLRAARLVVDTGLHSLRWSRQRAIDYFIDEVGSSTGQATQQIDRYLYYPGQACTYKIGMWKILELRARAQEELGDRFDIKQFHRVVLLHNRLPLQLLERLVDDYIERTQRLGPAPRRTTGRAR